jgi:N-methylhydantoinase B
MPDQRVLPAKTLLTFQRGDVFRHEFAGAGGRGDPLERDPRSVLADVRNGKVSARQARDAYRVVLAQAGTTVNEVATARLRSEIRRRPVAPPRTR